MNEWRYEDDENGDCFVVSPDNHYFTFGNMEGTSKCCFDNADFIIKACNHHKEIIDLLEHMVNDPCTSMYITHQIVPLLEKIKSEKSFWEKGTKIQYALK